MKRIVVPASFLIFALYGADPPAMKEGLWSIHTTTIDNPGTKKNDGTRSICRNHAYDTRIREKAEQMQKQDCKPVVRTSSGSTFTEQSECSVQGTVVTSKVVITYSGDTSIHSEMHATYMPALYGTEESTMIMDQKYVSGCPAGMEPGDSMGSDGKITHVKRP